MTDFINVNKELARAQSNGFTLVDNHEMVNMPNLSKPQLLTTLMGGADVTNRRYGMTSSFIYDEAEYTPVAVSSKRYDQRGSNVTRDVAKTRTFDIGSKGLRFNVAPADYDGKRIPGTNELMTEAYVLAQQVRKVMDAFDIERELEYGQILTAGTNRTSVSTSYDFHSDIIGGSRPAAAEIDFSGLTDPAIAIRAKVNLVRAKASAYGLSVERVIIVAGDNFFDAAYEEEKRLSFSRELRTNIDLASQAIPQLRGGNYSYDNFTSPTSGCEYVRYGASFFGSRVIGADDAYIVPILSGAGLVVEAYAPAKVRGIVNTEAREMYSWFYYDDFEGVVGMYESNRIQILPRPDLILNLTLDT